MSESNMLQPLCSPALQNEVKTSPFYTNTIDQPSLKLTPSGALSFYFWRSIASPFSQDYLFRHYVTLPFGGSLFVALT